MLLYGETVLYISVIGDPECAMNIFESAFPNSDELWDSKRHLGVLNIRAFFQEYRVKRNLSDRAGNRFEYMPVSVLSLCYGGL